MVPNPPKVPGQGRQQPQSFPRLFPNLAAVTPAMVSWINPNHYFSTNQGLLSATIG